MATHLSESRIATRLAAVDEHAMAENRHDLDTLVATFGDEPFWDDRSASERHDGRDGVRTYYAQLFAGFPDFQLVIERKHVAEEAVIMEVRVTGTHTGEWKGIPPTGKRVEFPVCAVFTFDDSDRIEAETVYFDRMTVLGQLGIL